MNMFKPLSSILLSCAFLTLLQGNGLAQEEPEQQRQEQQRQEQERQRIEQEQEQRTREARERFINESRESARRAVNAPPPSLSMRDREFVRTVPEFRGAVTAFREAMSNNASLREPEKEIERFIDIFKTYFKSVHVDPPPLNKSEFNEFSRKDLIWEALTSAERIDGDLRLAALRVQSASNTNSVSIQTMVFMRDLHGEIRRLELLLSKIQ